MLMQHNATTAIYLGQAGFVLALSVQFGVQGALMVETTPEPIRCTALAIGNNIAWSILGGLTPLAATWLIYRAQPGLFDRRRGRDHRRLAAIHQGQFQERAAEQIAWPADLQTFA
jgi:hypothetical protein